MRRSTLAIAWTLIALLAAAIRFAALGSLPAGLFRDEAEKGYNAWALATDGGVIEFPRDRQPPIRFKRWPFVVDVAGVATSAVYQYASIPFVKLFGLTIASTRMGAAAAGTLTVALLGLLLIWSWDGRRSALQADYDLNSETDDLASTAVGLKSRPTHSLNAYQPSWAALAAMLWLALSPWHYVFSRWALQGIFVPLGMVGVLAGLAGADRARRWGFPLAGGALGFVFYAYSGAQPFALLWGAALLAMHRREARAQWREAAAGAALFLAFAGPMLWITFFRGGDARLDAVALWTAEDATPARTAGRFVVNYLAHFNPVFLFARGDELARHAIPGFGQLLIIDLVLLPVGLAASFRRKLPLRGALLAAFLCGPVGAAITRVGIPHALRALPMCLPCAVWSGLGLASILGWILRPSPAHSLPPPRPNPLTLLGAALLPVAPPRPLGLARRRVLAVLFLFGCLLYSSYAFAAYWQKSAGAPGRDPIGGFAASHRDAFKLAFAERDAGSRIWINGHLPYAAYEAMFFGSLPARELAARGFEAQGIILFDPTSAAPKKVWDELMSPNDWMIDMTRDGEALAARKR